MKVLQVNCVYKKGSTGKIMCDIHKELLADGVESVICYGRGEKTSDAGVYKTCGELYSKLNNLLTRFTGIMYGGCLLATNKLISIIKKEKPDVVHLHCLNGYFVNIYRLVSWLNKNKIKTVLTLHAEFMHTGNCGHALECEKWTTGCGSCPRLKKETKSLLIDGTRRSWTKMKKAFEGFDTLRVTSVSPWLMERAKRSPILKDHKHTVVMNGLDTDVFHPYDTTSLREELGITDEKIIFHATPYFSDDKDNFKGGYYVIKLAEALKDKGVKVVVAGDHKADIKVPENMMLLGRVSDQVKLAKLYSLADLTVISSKKETFSMIVAESLCCGTPVVGFLAGGPESIAIDDYCEFIEHGDLLTLTARIEELLNHQLDAYKISAEATRKYSKKVMCVNYMTEYRQGVTDAKGFI